MNDTTWYAAVSTSNILSFNPMFADMRMKTNASVLTARLMECIGEKQSQRHGTGAGFKLLRRHCGVGIALAYLGMLACTYDPVQEGRTM